MVMGQEGRELSSPSGELAALLPSPNVMTIPTDEPHHLVHYKKEGIVLIIRKILTELRMTYHHDHNYLTICISFVKIKLDEHSTTR